MFYMLTYFMYKIWILAGELARPLDCPYTRANDFAFSPKKFRKSLRMKNIGLLSFLKDLVHEAILSFILPYHILDVSTNY